LYRYQTKKHWITHLVSQSQAIYYPLPAVQREGEKGGLGGKERVYLEHCHTYSRVCSTRSWWRKLQSNDKI